MWRCSTAAAFSGRVVVLRLAGVARVNWGIYLLGIVFGLLLMDVLFIVIVCDCVLQVGALLPTVGIAWLCRLLRAFCFTNILLLGGKSCGSILVVLSNLRADVRGTLRTCGMSLTILRVIGLLLFSFCAVCTLRDARAS